MSTTSRPGMGRLAIGVVLVVATACSSSAAQRSPEAATPSVESSQTEASPGAPLSESALPGTATRLHTPNAVLAVVDADDSGLPVLATPGGVTSATAWAGSNRLIATGRARQLPDGVWVEVTTTPQRTIGWSRSRNLVRTSIPEDVTDALSNRLGGFPSPAGMVDLGRTIAESEATHYPGSRVIQSRPAMVDVIGDVSFDVKIPDDEVIRGIRLRVVGQPIGGDRRFRMLAVERSLLCRGDATNPDGTCDLRCVYAHESPRWRMRDAPAQGGPGDAR